MDQDERSWASVGDETVEHLSNLIRFDTSNPPGNETPAALYLKQVFEREGFEEMQLLEAAPRRGNLIVRLRGDGSRRPLLLCAHLDTVPAEPAHWSQPPHGGVVADGQVWGRGALDMKHMAAMSLMALLLARRQNLRLKRDVIFAAVADEEVAGDLGARWLVENHPDLLRAEYALCELGGMMEPLIGLRGYRIQVAEKGVAWLRVHIHGQPGHGSSPHRENAVVRLAEAMARIGDSSALPLHLTPAAGAFIRALAGALPPSQGIAVRSLLNATAAPWVLKRMPAEQQRVFRPLLANTVSVTGLAAGVKANVIPSEATATLDCRLLPGQTFDDIRRELTELMGMEVEMEPLRLSPGIEFSTDTDLFRLLQQTVIAHDPQARPLPFMISAATDARQLARLGTIVYGFTPGQLGADLPLLRLIHGHNERIPVASLHWGTRVLYEVVKEFCS